MVAGLDPVGAVRFESEKNMDPDPESNQIFRNYRQNT